MKGKRSFEVQLQRRGDAVREAYNSKKRDVKRRVRGPEGN